MDLAERRGIEREVYEPAEDSRLLATTVAERVGADDRVLDVGTGTGFVAEHIREATGASVVASDVNPHACRRARDRGLSVARADLVAPFAADAFDVVAFNPPYLPAVDAGGGTEGGDDSSTGTDDSPAGDGRPPAEGGGGRPGGTAARDDPDGLREDWMEVALTGGETGRAVIDPFLADVGRVLAPGGAVYLLVSTLTGVDEVASDAARQGFTVAAVAEESFPLFETLTVLKLVPGDA